MISKPQVNLQNARCTNDSVTSTDLTSTDTAKEKFIWISQILEGVVESKNEIFSLSKFDRIMTNRVGGKFLSIEIILLSFLVAMMIDIPFMAVGSMIPKLIGLPIKNLLTSWHVFDWLVSIFSLLIPNVLYFSVARAGFVFGVTLVFTFLEEVGLLARIAYQFDDILSKSGLQGKAMCPILMGFGCTIGAASGTRVMDNWGQKMLTMAVVWAVPCASIWSVIPVISKMFFSTGGTILVCLGILCYMIFMMWITAKVFEKKLSPKENRTGMIMELPPYHKAHFGHILSESVLKAVDVFVRALKTVTIVSLLFWALSYSPSGNIENSLLYKVGTFIEPVTKFIGRRDFPFRWECNRCSNTCSGDGTSCFKARGACIYVRLHI